MAALHWACYYAATDPAAARRETSINRDLHARLLLVLLLLRLWLLQKRKRLY
jgi:hypothetical protein